MPRSFWFESTNSITEICRLPSKLFQGQEGFFASRLPPIFPRSARALLRNLSESRVENVRLSSYRGQWSYFLLTFRNRCNSYLYALHEVSCSIFCFLSCLVRSLHFDPWQSVINLDPYCVHFLHRSWTSGRVRLWIIKTVMNFE